MHIINVDVAVGRAVVVDAEHVDVDYGLAHDDAARAVVLQELIFEFQFLRLFEAQLAGEAVHLTHEVFGEFGGVAAQYLLDVAYVLAVGVGVDGARAASAAALDVVLQAQVAGAAGQVVLGDGQAARAYGV